MNSLDYDSMTDEEFVAALKLDEEERVLLESIENDEWVGTPNVEEKNCLSSIEGLTLHNSHLRFCH